MKAGRLSRGLGCGWRFCGHVVLVRLERTGAAHLNQDVVGEWIDRDWVNTLSSASGGPRFTAVGLVAAGLVQSVLVSVDEEFARLAVNSMPMRRTDQHGAHFLNVEHLTRSELATVVVTEKIQRRERALRITQQDDFAASAAIDNCALPWQQLRCLDRHPRPWPLGHGLRHAPHTCRFAPEK